MEVDPQTRSVAVYTDAESVRIATEEETIDGLDVLPGWQVDLTRRFAALDQRGGVPGH